MAEAAAPPSRSPAAIGAPCWITAIPLAAPASDLAPTWLTMAPTCTEISVPNGKAMRTAGKAVTVSRNQVCCSTSSAGSFSRTTEITAYLQTSTSSRTARPRVATDAAGTVVR